MNVYKLINASNPGGGGGGSSDPYTESFSGGGWTGPSGGEYSITILQSTHEKGLTPVVQVFENNGGIYDLVHVSISVNGSGDVVLKIGETPDPRFPGRVVII